MHSLQINIPHLSQVLENLLAILLPLGVTTAKVLVTVALALFGPLKDKVFPPWITGNAKTMASAAGP